MEPTGRQMIDSRVSSTAVRIDVRMPNEDGALVSVMLRTASEADEELVLVPGLLHHCEIICINGPSYQLRNRLAAIERDPGKCSLT
ncbi:hypothetical protein [Streptomyces sp. NPDC060035]|uniref:hypothetical protein n=1 Tax=Streptomyces sp. NPDC060035 TaxID=3347044 RepID=UPI0036B7F915